MSEKKVVVCDLHTTNHPGTRKITIDVCEAGYTLLLGHIGGERPYPCPEPGCERVGARGFNSKPGLTKHLTDTHGYEPSTQRARERRAAAANGPTQDHAGTMAQ